MPTGSVEFYDGTTPLGAGSTLSGGGDSAFSTFTISTLNAAVHAIYAIYTPTGLFVGSASSHFSEPVTPASLNIYATSDTKVYDGTTVSTAAPTFQVAGEPVDTLYNSDTLTGLVQAFDSKDVLGSDGSTLEVTGYAVNDGNAGADYTVSTNAATGTITPAALSISVTPYTFTYDGNPHTATGTATGVSNENLSGDLDLSGTTHLYPGTYSDTWTFHDPNGNYADASGPVSDTIKRASATIVVNNPTDTPIAGEIDLRQAIVLANGSQGPDTITVSMPQVITLTGGPLELTDSATTTIIGPCANLLSISGNNASPVFVIDAGALAAISGLTNSAVSVISMPSGGVGVSNAGTLSLTGVAVSGNSAAGNGGGLYNSGTATLTDVTVSGNSAGGNGGGIFNSGTLSLISTTISDNSATGAGGGLYNLGTATLTSTTVSGNSATSGGGLYNYGGGIDSPAATVTLGNTIVAANSATLSGPNVQGAVASEGYNLIGETDGSSGWVDSDLTERSTRCSPRWATTADRRRPWPCSPAARPSTRATTPCSPAGITADHRPARPPPHRQQHRRYRLLRVERVHHRRHFGKWPVNRREPAVLRPAGRHGHRQQPERARDRRAGHGREPRRRRALAALSGSRRAFNPMERQASPPPPTAPPALTMSRSAPAASPALLASASPTTSKYQPSAASARRRSSMEPRRPRSPVT